MTDFDIDAAQQLFEPVAMAYALPDALAEIRRLRADLRTSKRDSDTLRGYLDHTVAQVQRVAAACYEFDEYAKHVRTSPTRLPEAQVEADIWERFGGKFRAALGEPS